MRVARNQKKVNHDLTQLFLTTVVGTKTTLSYFLIWDQAFWPPRLQRQPQRCLASI